jgi:hypothetical protein
MARTVLCKDPTKISDTNLGKLVDAINSSIPKGSNKFNNNDFIDQINSRQSYDKKWEYLKDVLGGLDNELDEVRVALKDAGSVSFYKADFEHRKDYYVSAWDAANQRYSEEINLYVRKIGFILDHISNSSRRQKYEKYLLSQLSKYDIAFVFYYALVFDDPCILELFSKCGLLKEVQRLGRWQMLLPPLRKRFLLN